MKRWWALFCVRNAFACILLVMLLLASPKSFALELFPYALDYGTNPAKFIEPSFGGVFWMSAGGPDLWWAETHGEWKIKKLGIHFAEKYLSMDSLYRENFSNVDVSLQAKYFAVGVGYGFSADWIPGREAWLRHQISPGASFFWKDFQLSVWGRGYTDESWTLLNSLEWRPSPHFIATFITDYTSFDLGNSLCFEYGCLTSIYRFPSFSFSVALTLFWGKWELGGAHGFGGENQSWHSFSVEKKLF